MEFDFGMMFLYFTAICFWTIVIYVNGAVILKRIKRRMKKKEDPREKFDHFIDSLNQMADEVRQQALKEASYKERPGGREESIFQWRHGGEMHEVKIIIDPELDSRTPKDMDELRKMVADGSAGNIEDISGDEKAKKSLLTQTEFRFSRRTVEHLRQAGKTPDEIVAKILRDTGRMD